MVVSALLGQAADSLDQPIGGAGFQQDAARRCASRTSASVTRGPGGIDEYRHRYIVKPRMLPQGMTEFDPGKSGSICSGQDDFRGVTDGHAQSGQCPPRGVQINRL